MNRSIGYWLRNKLYVNVTNRTTSIATPLSLRGPSFIMPKESGFHPLPDGYEPSVDEMVKVIDEAYEQGKINVDSMKSEEVTFAGLGEPLLRLDDLAETARMIKSMRHGVPLRIKTNGLILSKESATVAQTLKDSGFKHISISLIADNPKLYQEIMKPTNGASFGDVCAFTIACVEAGLNVTCTTVERPGINISAVRSLAQSLGAPSFETQTYFP